MDRVTADAASLEQIGQRRLIAILRADQAEALIPAAEALLAGGVDVVEFALTTPGAVDQIRAARQRFGNELLLGAGTVIGEAAAEAALAAGARFLVAPCVQTRVLALCQQRGALLIPGALTPTEIVAAVEGGASLVKLFPASLGGPSYLREVRAPLPGVRLVPTGGITLENAQAFLDAGAAALGVGSSLVVRRLLAAGDWPALTELARTFSRLAAPGPAVSSG
jgi:2-dehydro-3-deoxyphosphogluconate aldolase/(4S)-4-hydroxy-2-oxoglutarate aldolase